MNVMLFVGRELGANPHAAVYDLVSPANADGVVLLTAGLAASLGLEAIDELIARYRGLPICSVGVALEGIPSVVADNRPGMRDLVEHFIVDHGRRRIAFLRGHERNPDAEIRYQVYKEALARHGIPFDPMLVAGDAFAPASGSQATEKLLSRGVAFDAIVSNNDAAAIGALDALHAAGLRVPTDVALSGFDDLPVCRFMKPPLTTVRQPITNMATSAVELVWSQLQGESVPAVTVLPVSLVRRMSCGCHVGAVNPEPPTKVSIARRAPDWFDDRRTHLEFAIRERLQLPVEPEAWVGSLFRALQLEFDGEKGRLEEALEEIMSQSTDRERAYEELQHALVILRDESLPACPDLAPLWSSAQRALAAASVADQARQRVGLEVVYRALLRTGESFATAFDLGSLRRILQRELPDVVLAAFISLTRADRPSELEPFFGFNAGAVREVGQEPFRAELLIPPGQDLGDRRRTWAVLPLTFEHETLGLAVVESRRGIGVHEMLRTQIGSALKSVALHQEIVLKTALHGRTVQEKAESAKRLNALSVLAGGVAHDLNNALGPLVVMPDLILRQLQARGEGAAHMVVDDLNSIKAAALRAIQTIKDLLALGRQGHTTKEPTDLNRVAKNSYLGDPYLRELAAKKNTRVTLEVSDVPLLVNGSEGQISRAVSNLLHNALDAVEGSGLITLRTRKVTFSENVEAYEIIEAGTYAVLEVGDSGRGIEKEHLGRIFEPFFSRKRLSESSGSGLGLAIVHGVVKEHQGFVDVVTELGLGSTFVLYFPLLPAELTRDSELPHAVPGQGRILVIDDEAIQRRTASRVLQTLGYNVVTAESSREALRLFDEARSAEAGPFDLVIVDVCLNETLDGVELMERLQQLAPGQRGIVVSGQAPTERVDRAVGRGLPFVSKPYNLETLGRAVLAALGVRR
jgi:DNA-binding LacI/PurR family transcriptional regulator/signal transduction histidine kinase/ActR/RegA family two-component response regulator